MDRHLLRAATTGDAISLQQLASGDPAVLIGTTPQGNSCLNIAGFHGHEGFCRDVLDLNQSLLTAINAEGETPLLTAVTSGHTSLASMLLSWLGEAMLNQVDIHGCNSLHHAIRCGHRELALELIAAAPALLGAVNNYNESPMFIAVMRNYVDVTEKLLEVPGSTHVGPGGQNALYAAVRNGNSIVAKKIVEACPEFLRQENDKHATPVLFAVLENRTDVLRVLLEHDSSLGYEVTTTDGPDYPAEYKEGASLLCAAAFKGHVEAARVILQHCPYAPCWIAHKGTCLHLAAQQGHTEFIKFVMQSQELRKLVNMRDINGKTPLDCLDIEVRKRNKELVAALLCHQNRDVTVLINNSGPPIMDQRLLEAATSGDATRMEHLAQLITDVLSGTTPQGNTCLHISALHGHKQFSKDVLDLNPSLLSAVNANGETPLLTTVTSGHTSLASFFLRFCREQRLGEVILKQDMHGCNALHHAIRSGHKELALELIEANPALSGAVNKYNESPMFVAVMRNYTDVFEKLLEVPNSAHVGSSGQNALHAAVGNGNSVIAKRIIEARPDLARQEENTHCTPLHVAVVRNATDVLRVLLEHDNSLGYVVSSNGWPLLCWAAYRGLVDVARVILQHCPDAPSWVPHTCETCLHVASRKGHTEFVKFVIQSQELRKLINMRDNKCGDTALHNAVRECNPKMVAALLSHQDRDVTVLNNEGSPAIWVAIGGVDYVKTLNWNEVCTRMLKAESTDTGIIDNLRNSIKNKVIQKSRKDIKPLTETYTSNTSLVAILIATITFAAAFTIPGGYSSDSESQGLPIMARKIALQAFLISDTLAMCSSFSVAFICIVARWEDLEFLLHYRSITMKLMWFAYMATTTAFATGLYTVLAPRALWLAIAICIVSVLMPLLTYLIGKWPVLELMFRLGLGLTFKSELLSHDHPMAGTIWIDFFFFYLFFFFTFVI